jgi:DNA mismatch endonuclease (patch repair protein)
MNTRSLLSTRSFTAVSKETSKRMRSVRQRDTSIEVPIRSLLHRTGYRFRIDQAPVVGLRRRADIIFTSAKVAVFIDGCFWHGCPQHGTWPKNNREFWQTKIEQNRLRDRDTNLKLRSHGWLPLRFWGHESPDVVVRLIAESLKARSV